MLDNDLLQKAIKILDDGGLVGIPTETVYGLAADAENQEAVQSIYKAKNRPSNHPLIVHLANAKAIPRWASDFNEDAKKLTDTFWPGPLTIILKKSDVAKDFVTGGQDTVALRCPSHPIAHRLLEIFDRGQGKGLAAPSANSFGRISPSTAQHVRDDLGEKPEGKVDLIIDGGPCEVGIESTILDLSGDTPRILREGAIDSDQISSVIGKPVMHGTVYNSPRVSGTLKSHYAPKHKMEMVSVQDLPGRTQFLARQFKTFGLIAPEKIARRFKPVSEKTFAYSSVPELSAHLYQWMHDLDKEDIDRIFVVPPEYSPSSAGVLDRLTRASAKKE
ncbi:L-threonylcarbamoyladenylate synthase [Turicimonas muris]|uniref:Threonylcarbamoyl-AMP synthase n=5 Tax=Turicimonas muris TaxID=1796652 RepID=A0A227KR51_9BURK|nr:L-threonylcarbamoyladenylate synthase [Turicimonas muris]ANU65157.1 threonylcarbamoyl-AMP synthase [Burkholderiales bacterium YL45]OXE50962.1 threonylcarbamoyl-AMP synthase [Turicimonas muris]QQQ96315.1 threonylcarbamoyl-AMP synthase [Turicimonas muris]